MSVPKCSEMHLGNRIYEPCHEKTCLCHVRTTKADQPADPHSLISAFVVRCLDSIPLFAKADISRP